MVSRVALTALAAATALVVAGCGGGAPVRADALKAVPGASHPRVVRVVDLPPDLDRVRYALVLMTADSAFHLRCVRVPDHGSRVCHPHYARVAVELNVGNNIGSPGDVCCWLGLTASQVAAVEKARNANPKLRRFPDLTEWNFPCAIPHPGAPGGTIAGQCWTDAEPPNHVRYVNFSESWKPKNGSQDEDHWVVAFNQEGQVRSISHQRRLTNRDVSRLLRGHS